MVNDCQNAESEKKFVNNLLSLAKELEKLEHTRQFRKEFENETSNFPFKKPEVNCEEQNPDVENKNEKDDECLKMEVYDDKDYDIEEIKFWNFISKNKGIKPSIIRTIVYKVPESSYVVRKCPVIIDEPEPKKTEIPKEAETSHPKDQKENNKLENKSDIISSSAIKVEKIAPVVPALKKPTPSLIKQNEPVKFSSEDIILIDEDDDIIGFDEENEEKDYKKLSLKENEPETENIKMDDDDDIIEEEVAENSDKESDKQIEVTENTENENDDEADNEISIDKKLSILQNSIQIQKKQQKRGRGLMNRPKVVMEKANEPASMISVKKNSDFDSKISTRSKGTTSSSCLNKSLPVITHSKSIVTRKSMNVKSDLKKKADQLEMANSVSSSSSTVSTISASVLNNTIGSDLPRVTRSKAKLIENK